MYFYLLNMVTPEKGPVSLEERIEETFYIATTGTFFNYVQVYKNNLMIRHL